MDSININNSDDCQLFIKRIIMTEREKWLKEMDEFLAELRKKNGQTKY